MARSTVKKNVSRRNTSQRGRSGSAEEGDILSTVVLLLVVIAISILLFVAVLGYGGAFGVAGRIVLFGIFGIFAYAFPVALASGTCYAVTGSGDNKRVLRIIYAIITYMLAALLMELFLHGDKPVGGIEAFQIGQMGHTGGGFIGGFFSGLFVRIFGVVGAYVLAFAGLAICLVLLTENVPFLSGDRPAAKQRRPVKRNSTDRQRRTVPQRRVSRPRRERQLQEPEETEQQDDEVLPQESKVEDRKRFVGIANTTILPGHSAGSDEVTEIKLEAEELEDTVEDERQPDIVKKSADTNTLKSQKDTATEVIDEPVKPSEDVVCESEPDITEVEISHTDDSDLKAVYDPDRTLKPRSVGEISADIEPEPLIKDAVEDVTEYTDDDAAFTDGDVVSSEVSETAAEQQSKTESVVSESPHEVSEYVLPGEKLEKTLADFGVKVTITDTSCGPTVTRYELQPEKGVKVSKIVNLADDIKLNLAAEDIRIEAPIPGKAAIGIEVPNRESEVVSFRDMMESEEFLKAESRISFAVGKDIGGRHVVSDIAKMPHVLIAGATGAGKSVCINTIIMSILYKARPDEVKFIMIDPKVVELSVYNGIPHLLIPVVTDPKKAAGALHWAVKEMMDRYERFAKTGVRDMKGYNAKIYNGQLVYEEGGKTIEVMAEKMPQIVVIVDELADLMMVASNEVEEAICRLAQLARAAGIHLVIATQRPSVNVITGLIKANMPSRIAFSVTSGVDSRTILDMVGAEKLLGKGDMLYYPQGLTKPKRVQGAFVSDDEVARVVDFIKKNNGNMVVDSDIEKQMQEVSEASVQTADNSAEARSNDRDVYYDEAARLLIEKEKGSIGMLQRYFKIGFNRAARIMDQLEEGGVVGPEEGTKPRKILMTMAQFEGGEEEITEDE